MAASARRPATAKPLAEGDDGRGVARRPERRRGDARRAPRRVGLAGRGEARDGEGGDVALSDRAAGDQDAAVGLQRQRLAQVVARAGQQAHDARRAEAGRGCARRAELGDEQTTLRSPRRCPRRAASTLPSARTRTACSAEVAIVVVPPLPKPVSTAPAAVKLEIVPLSGRGDVGAVGAHGDAVVDPAGEAGVEQRAVVGEAVDRDAGGADRRARRGRGAPGAAAVASRPSRR